MPDDDLPVMSLWVQKLFGSSRVAECHGFAQGVYLLLLAREHGFRGRGLPSDDAALARLAGLDRPDWDRVRDQVLQFFELRPDGRLVNSTCEEQIAEAIESRDRVREQRRCAARARWGTDQEGSSGGTPQPPAPTGTDAGRNAAAYAPALRPDMRLQCPPSPSPSEDEIPPLPPASGGGAGGEILSAAKKALACSTREARRLLREHPALTARDLQDWADLPARRPDLLEGVRSPPAYLRALAWRYGTVAAAGAAGPPREAPEVAREEALRRRNEELRAELRDASAREALSPDELREAAGQWRRRKGGT